MLESPRLSWQSPIIICDEPTAGLDPEERLRFRDLIKQTNCDDKIIIISTHIVDDAEFLCDYIEIIDQGYIIAKDTTDGIKTAMTRLLASPSIDTSEPASADPTLEDGYMYILKSYRNGV